MSQAGIDRVRLAQIEENIEALERERDDIKDLMLPINTDDSECYQCTDMAEHNSDLDTIREAHNKCHEWFHCDIACCGGCPHCEE